jgi:cytochrome c
VKGALLALLLVITACHRADDDRTARELTGGIPSRGREAIARYGCGACHAIPGVGGATGLVGPPLANIGERMILAGQLPNTPNNMIRWIRQPQQVESGTSMPNLHVGEHDARDMAAYLYTLRQ